MAPSVELPRGLALRLDGRRALVAGASRGTQLGRAETLAEAGAEVVVAARGAEALEAVAGAMARPA